MPVMHLHVRERKISCTAAELARRRRHSARLLQHVTEACLKFFEKYFAIDLIMDHNNCV